MSLLSSINHWFFPHESNNRRARILHPTGISLLIALIIVFQFGISWFSSRYPQVLGYASQITANQIIEITNQKRREQGLPALKTDPQLTAAAAAKGADMMARNYWAHVSPIGTQPWFFITQAGYGYRYAGENLARDFNDSPSVVQAWIDSPSHRENLFNSKYQDIGVAVIDGTLTGHQTTLVVQMFGTKLTAQANPAPQTLAVKAAATDTPVAAANDANPFTLTKIFFLLVLLVLLIVLVVDVVEIRRQKIIRWTSKSMAHLLFVIVLIIAIILVSRGKII